MDTSTMKKMRTSEHNQHIMQQQQWSIVNDDNREQKYRTREKNSHFN
jgi:hypothetical protein